MKCFFCKGNLVDTTTSDFTDFGDCIIVVRGVPCHKCTECGEVVFDLRVGERVEQIVDELKDSMQEVAIVRYSPNAA
ncbi:MAG: type II toxin-antitoxin system MqsA family antitoxin [Defluviitaleaceae bacterium]|nr:type II toxin-antitoxin system MqsA family antitoxin [Defluviitaleaceae bacterium]MCL2239439.1 type II toxin-antitoxin system MqsA family antitoxin [Defluviitaleaceae bacterium]